MPGLALESEQLHDPRFGEHIAEINRYCDSLRELKPGTEVPYVDPAHNAEEARVVCLFANTGTAPASGFIEAGDQEAVVRLLGIQWQLGLRPEYVMPWNVHPWFVPGQANGKLGSDQISAGLKPLLRLLALAPRTCALVAHGTEAHRLADLLTKTENPLLWRRGFKTYKVRSLGGRGFAGPAQKQAQWLDEMQQAYGDAMARCGLPRRS